MAVGQLGIQRQKIKMVVKNLQDKKYLGIMKGIRISRLLGFVPVSTQVNIAFNLSRN